MITSVVSGSRAVPSDGAENGIFGASGTSSENGSRSGTTSPVSVGESGSRASEPVPLGVGGGSHPVGVGREPPLQNDPWKGGVQ